MHTTGTSGETNQRSFDPRRFGLGLKLTIIVAVAAVAAVITATTTLSRLEGAIADGRNQSTQKVVEVGLGVIEHFHSLEADGSLTRDEAQAAAREGVRDLRYSGEEYYFIINNDLVMEMHPIKPELDGADLSGSADPDGVLLFVEMVDVVAADGEGFVGYQWPKPGFEEPQPKVSYVAGFEPWGWIIGSGVYTDDIKTQAAEERQLLLLSGGIFVLLMLIGGWAIRSLFCQLERFSGVASKIAGGDLSIEPLDVRQGGSIGRLGDSFDEMTTTLRSVSEQAAQIADGNISSDHSIPGELGETFDQMLESLDSTVKQLNISSVALSAAAQDLGGVAAQVGSNAEMTAREATSSSEASDEVSASVSRD